jgi:predicted dienelactone hydrolase
VTFLCDALRSHLADIAARAGMGDVPATLWPSWGSKKVDAVVALAGDAVMFAGRGLDDVSVPVLTIGGTADQDAPFRWGTQLAFEHTTGPRRAEAGLVGAEHLVFTGPCERSRRLLTLVSTPFCADPAWPKADAHALVRSLVTAFLRSELIEDADARRWLSGPAGLPDTVRYRSEGS